MCVCVCGRERIKKKELGVLGFQMFNFSDILDLSAVTVYRAGSIWSTTNYTQSECHTHKNKLNAKNINKILNKIS